MQFAEIQQLKNDPNLTSAMQNFVLANSEQNGDLELSAEISAQLEALMAEQPKLDAAIKNFFSLKVAENFADAKIVHKLARDLSLEFNAYEMPEAPQWGDAHPQGEDQTALDRMGEIGSYKRLLALRKTIAKSPQAKATKLLGRTWAANVFPKVREHMEASTAGYDEETVELRKAFLDGFALEMEGNHLNTLVWTTDLAGALRARHTERAYDASQRVQRQAANASEVDQMRSMMTNLVANAKQDGYSGAPL
mmetsp:Transcript_20736/g.39429  ORF Transcript_20736/g.39429 Transcript_20736/m.39429 type:complete len:251 (-) Transcript_20736:246-998(-)